MLAVYRQESERASAHAAPLWRFCGTEGYQSCIKLRDLAIVELTQTPDIALFTREYGDCQNRPDGTENPCVGGSIPFLATILRSAAGDGLELRMASHPWEQKQYRRNPRERRMPFVAQARLRAQGEVGHGKTHVLRLFTTQSIETKEDIRGNDG